MSPTSLADITLAGIFGFPRKDMVNNKFRIWLVRFGRTASLTLTAKSGTYGCPYLYTLVLK